MHKPSQSPDLNKNKNLWWNMKKKSYLTQKSVKIMVKDYSELFLFETLVLSKPHRFKTVIANKVLSTKYYAATK